MRLGERFFEGVVEFVQDVVPLHLLVFDLVEIGLDMAGEADVHDLREVGAELLGDDVAARRGVELAIFLLHIAAILNRLDDRRVGARPADAFGLERFDQRRFGESRRWGGELLLGFDRNRVNRLALLERG